MSANDSLGEKKGWRRRTTKRGTTMDDCRPLGFLIGLPFAILSLVLSAIGIVIWLAGSIVSCLCPCCCCCAALANAAMDLVQLPLTVIRCFVDQIPC